MSPRILTRMLLPLVLTLPAAQASAAYITAVPEEGDVTLGESFEVALNIFGLGDLTAPSLGGFDIDLAFDPTRLDYVGTVFGDPDLGDQLDIAGFGADYFDTPAAGSINLFGLSYDSIADLHDLQAGAFTLATLTFTALQMGVTPLLTTINSLSEADPTVALTGTALASSVNVPAPATLYLLLGALGGIGALRLRGSSAAA